MKGFVIYENSCVFAGFILPSVATQWPVLDEADEIRTAVAPRYADELNQSSHQNAVQNNGRYSMVKSSASGDGSYCGSLAQRRIVLYGLRSAKTLMSSCRAGHCHGEDMYLLADADVERRSCTC